MPMSQQTFYKMTAAVFQKCVEVMEAKGQDYAHDENKLANFERQEQSMGIPALMVLRVYLQKHLDAFDAYVKSSALESEALEMRVVDIINYFMLALGLCVARGYVPREGWLKAAVVAGVSTDLDVELKKSTTEHEIFPAPALHVVRTGGKDVAVCCNPEGDDCCE